MLRDTQPADPRVEAAVGHLITPESIWHRRSIAVLNKATRSFETTGSYVSFAPEFLTEAYAGFSTEEVAGMHRHQGHSFLWNAKRRMVSRLIQTHMPESRHVLDIGCGTGFITEAIATVLPHATVFGTDIYLNSIELASKKLKDRGFVFHMNATAIPFCDTFDLVTSFDVLEHIQDDEKAISEIRASLVPGGVCFLGVPQHPWLWSPADEHAHHFRRYRKDELQEKLKRAGFSIVWTSSFISLLLPAMALSRWKSRLVGNYNLDAEHLLPGSLTRMLLAITDLELTTLRAGVRYPVGGTRLVIARRI